MKILVTGGLGYIGSHVATMLVDMGHEVVIIDNFSNTTKDVLAGIEKSVLKKSNRKNIFFEEGDILNNSFLHKIFSKYNISTVMHFAGLKSVFESHRLPLKYYKNNFSGTVNLLDLMNKFGVHKLIFSSSATIYGDICNNPIDELSDKGNITNPYGQTKLMVENMLFDFALSNPEISIGILRYFNPVGAHKKGFIGELPVDTPNNLVPYVAEVASGKRDYVNVYGSDYDTFDGTGIRDYIHVSDLADGHIAALEWINKNSGIEVWNLGTGRGYSVLQVIETFKKISGKEIKYKMVGRRNGDIGECYADPLKAEKQLNWKAKLDLEDMLLDSWNWQKKI